MGLCPWIGVFDRDISLTAQRGYDIVYLFCTDMSGVYLSLNQGWSYFKNCYGTKEGRKRAAIVTQSWRESLSSALNDFDFAPIDLKASNALSNLPRGYKMCHICGKFYPAQSIPDEDVLRHDLQNMLSLFRELKGRLIHNSIEETNDAILAQAYTFPHQTLTPKQERSDAAALNKLLAGDGSGTKLLLQAGLPNMPIVPAADSSGKRKAGTSRPDYIGKAISQAKLGRAGELMVMEYERQQLQAQRSPLLPTHVSEKDGDSVGFDIKSYFPDGIVKYIEVKTTTSGPEQTFFLSRRELAFAKEHAENYYLYRIYHFNPISGHGDLVIFHGDPDDNFTLEPETYVGSIMSQPCFI